MSNNHPLQDPQSVVQVMRHQPVLVAGAGVAGRGVINMLEAMGAAEVTIADDHSDLAHVTVEQAIEKIAAGEFQLLITSPGWAPTSPLLVAAQKANLPIIGDIEAAWLADQAEVFGPARTWAAITGTNGKTTTTAMLTAMCIADGQAAVAVGNIGVSPAHALTAEGRGEPRADILVAEVSSFQLHWAPTFTPDVGCVLNIAEDHLDWHGSLAGYASDKARVLRAIHPVFALDDAHVMSFFDPNRAADSSGFTARDLDEPDLPDLSEAVVTSDLRSQTAGQQASYTNSSSVLPKVPRIVGANDGSITLAEVTPESKARSEDTDKFALHRLAPADGISPPGPAGIADASAAAAMACALGVAPSAIEQALAAFQVQAHRGQVVCERDGVRWVDNSKATNPHAAAGALRGQSDVIWIAGGQLKGANVSELIAETKQAIKAVVALGVDRQVIAEELQAQVPEVPLTLVATTDPEQAMEEVVRACAHYAESGDTVVLAPAAASLDMFQGMAQRGDLFAQYAAQVELR